MAKSNAVWGIDIGQCAVKALRCVPHDEPGKIVADAFDFIEYPKILSQPEADPVELVRDALKQFLSRNKVRGDRVAISVPGQSGLARFIKLPPVEAKKIPDIVRYEARQQIPFALEDVVWDYQQMAGGSEEDGFALETEVGLFAMKRDQAARALRPFNEAAIEVDIVQLTPLAIYNYIVFDQLQDLPPVEDYNAKDPPPSIIVVSLGTDTTDLVVTNGYRVWQRNIPLGGNHFTKALTKELKLTFTKAEHLKRNALKAEDPKAVFLAMRPVFNDLVTEVQRSISFFQSVDRSAKIGRVVTLGNAMKLRGLQKYLAQSLGYEVIDLDEYRGLSGAAVVGAPSFRENLLSFAVCYGLCLQGLKQSQLRTNLIPREILQDRLIRAKKPWAVGAVAAMLLACSVGFMGYYHAFRTADDNDKSGSESAKSLKSAEVTATEVKSRADRSTAEFATAKTNFDKVKEMGERLSGVQPRKIMWVELMKAISDALPRDTSEPPPLGVAKPEDLQAALTKSRRIVIDRLDCEHFTRLEDWFADVKDKYEGPGSAVAAAPMAGPNNAGLPPGPPPGDAAPPAAGPSGEGWVIQIVGHHYHNQDPGNEGAEYIRRTLLRNLIDKPIPLPDKDGKLISLLPKDMGISYPVLVRATRAEPEDVPLPGATPGDQPGQQQQAGAQPQTVPVMRCDFTLQFVWKETPIDKRMELLEKQKPASEKPPAMALGNPPEAKP
ncbi:MAG TPA: type IV pilus assembly protein PilM [Pirellulales bacterium]|jgi:type IV pilus assembly protein PilM|nr:type IV pilus assembly protein PilM [Pirellulales bacterium]